MPEGTHAVSEQGFDDLVTAFSIFSADDEDMDTGLHSFGVEMLALVTAFEIVLPLPRRMRLIEKFGTELDHDRVCIDHGLPMGAVNSAFKPKNMKVMETIYKRNGLI